ncbi:MAG: hypothetical protein ACTHU0_11250 [Kofleriaceae bacterium]
MGGSTEYRVLIDGRDIDRALYARIETITVEQAIDLASEARIELEMCADDRGAWNGPTDPVVRTWRRVRIELDHMGSGWVPLIDGPIVAWNAAMSGQPGQSMLVLTVHDDSVYLNRRAEARVFEGRTDTEVARSLLQSGPITEVDVDPLPERPPDRRLQHMRAGTEIDLLLELARPYGMHVFVRPGAQPGRSIGCLKRLDVRRSPRLPTLVLVGPKRNVDELHVRSDGMLGARHAGARLDIGDLAVKTYTSSWKDLALLGDEDAIDDAEQLGLDLVDSVDAALYDLQEAAEQRQQRASYLMVATGSVRAGCYGGVLTAYDVVAVSGADEKLCTKFVIREVTHTLGRSEYRQDFTLIANSVAKVDRRGNPIPPEIRL